MHSIDVGALIAAAASPLAMTIGFIIWGECWIGSAFTLNTYKCFFASLLFLVVALSIRVPTCTAQDFGMIALSSFLGIIIGDNAWLQALKMIGARRVIAIDSLKPFLAAILGSYVLHEPFNTSIVVGLVLSSIGILVVTLEKEGKLEDSKAKEVVGPMVHDLKTLHKTGRMEELVEGSFSDREQIEVDLIFNPEASRLEEVNSNESQFNKIGYLYAAINVILDAYGSVLTKQYGYSMNTWEINLYRFGFAAICLSFIILLGNLYYRLWGGYFRMLLNDKLVKIGLLSSYHDGSFTLLVDESSHDSSANLAKDCESNISIELNGISSSGSCDVINPITSHNAASYLDDCTENKYKLCNDNNLDNHVDDSNDTIDNNLMWFDFPIKLMPYKDWIKVSIGVLFVTFLCPAMSNYSLFRLDLGLCLTLTSLGPVYSLPALYCMKREPVTLRAVFGVACVVSGVIILTMSP